MVKKSGLGKGLGSLIPIAAPKVITTTGSVDEKDIILHVSVKNITQNPHQPRKEFTESQLDSLMNSIREHGILQPLVVTKLDKEGFFELVAGERRLRASEGLGLKTVPCILRVAKDLEKLELALIENIQREDLNPIEKAMAYKKMLDEFNTTHDDAARRLGLTRSTFSNVVRILDLPEVIQKAVADGRISEGVARVIIAAPSEKERLEIFEKVISESLNLEKTTHEVKKRALQKRHPALQELDAEIKDMERRIQNVLATKVQIKAIGRKGKIIIDYYSFPELETICGKIEKGGE